jgi:hypothetical protein
MRADDMYAPHIERAPSVPSVDQTLARKFGDRSRFRSLQIGVVAGIVRRALQKNMSWAGPNGRCPRRRSLTGCSTGCSERRTKGWIDDKTTILDAVRQDAALLRRQLPRKKTRCGSMSTSSSIRDLERAIVSLPPEYKQVTEPESGF